MAKIHASIALTLFLCLICCTFSDTGEKRILLNDPDYVLQTKMDSMQAEFQKLSSKVSQQEREISQLKSQLAVYSKNTPDVSNTGATFIRWGREQCPNNESDILYTGYVGGSSYDQPGGSGEYVCLPSDPIYALKDPQTDLTWSAFIYGSEYETLFAADSHDEDVPCAMCISRTRSRKLMIPGRNQCYAGWTKEFSGFLASNSHQNAAAGQYICIDEHPEYVPSGIGNKNGNLFYFVISVCGSLPCPPYINNRPLTCVVCTK